MKTNIKHLIALLLLLCVSQTYQKVCQSCTLSKEVTEGPYYVSDEASNITEGKSGLPVTLAIKVVDTTNCNPIANAIVDVWHCDATGVYSYYESVEGVTSYEEDTTYLRGQLYTDSTGTATFSTIFPGHYTGRTNHIHLKVKTSATTNIVYTGQLFFQESLTLQVEATSPYTSNRQSRTTLAQDSIHTQAGDTSMATTSLVGSTLSDGLIASLTVGINGGGTSAPTTSSTTTSTGSSSVTTTTISPTTSSAAPSTTTDTPSTDSPSTASSSPSTPTTTESSETNLSGDDNSKAANDGCQLSSSMIFVAAIALVLVL